MLNLMHRLGRVEDGSLLHARTPVMLEYNAPRRGTPWHFIYNLALKHFEGVPSARDPQPVLEEMEELACDLAAAIDVEPHSSYENMVIPGSWLSGILFETTIYDELFAFPQWQPRAAESIVPLWIEALGDAGCKFPDFSSEAWKAIAASLIATSKSSSIEPLSAADLQSRVLPRAQAARALELLSQNTATLNKGYRTPFDTTARISSWRPVIKTSRGGHFVQPTAITTRAFCERLYSLMRKESDPNIENKVGSALELATLKSLEASNIKPKIVNGSYHGDAKGTVLEADIVVETDDRIFLIECTKKFLTSAARRGNTLATMQDLEGSFLKLVQQLAGHEARLRRDGEIRFNDGKVLELRHRAIEKIGINLFDHGSLQNRDFTIALVELIAGGKMDSASPAADAAVAAVNRRLDRIDVSLRRIVAAQGGDRDRALHKFAMSTWWLSLDQLRYITIKGEGDLWRGLSYIRNVTARSGDLVYEVKRSLSLNEGGLAHARQYPP